MNMNAAKDLESFVKSAVYGLVDHQDKVRIEVVTSGERTVTLIISCDPNDLKFIYSRSRAIKFIAIAIAQRHKTIVNLIVNE